MTSGTPISLIVHTRNSVATLPRLLETTAWFDERIVVDMASADDTVVLATEAGCTVLATPAADAVDAIRNNFLDRPRNEWVLVLDSDEHLSADAEVEIGKLIERHGASVDAFAIPRFNTIAGQVMRGSGFYPDCQIRLFRRGTIRWSLGHHHPPDVLTGRLMVLSPPCVHIHHLNYPDLQSFIERQLRYALTDTYDRDADFHFEDHVGEAYEAFARRHDKDNDGDLSTALATVLAWDRIMRGLIHWEKLGRKHPLSSAFSLPIATTVHARRPLSVGERPSLLRSIYGLLPWPVRNLLRRVRSRLSGR